MNLDVTADELRIECLTVDFGSFCLGPVDLVVKPGQVHCLVGINGSGKSTLIRAALGLGPLTSGSVGWLGGSVRDRSPELLVNLGYVSDSADDLVPQLTAEEYWLLCGLSYARLGRPVQPMLERAAAIAVRLDLQAPRRTPLGNFSLGMRRKAQIAAALMHDPALVILDEPLTGLDYLTTRRLESLLTEQAASGAAVWMVGHELGVVTRIADEITALKGGRVVGRLSGDDYSGLEELEERLNGFFEACGAGA